MIMIVRNKKTTSAGTAELLWERRVFKRCGLFVLGKKGTAAERTKDA
jgi:hypothetical protein